MVLNSLILLSMYFVLISWLHYRIFSEESHKIFKGHFLLPS